MTFKSFAKVANVERVTVIEKIKNELIIKGIYDSIGAKQLFGNHLVLEINFPGIILKNKEGKQYIEMIPEVVLLDC